MNKYKTFLIIDKDEEESNRRSKNLRKSKSKDLQILNKKHKKQQENNSDKYYDDIFEKFCKTIKDNNINVCNRIRENNYLTLGNFNRINNINNINIPIKKEENKSLEKENINKILNGNTQIKNEENKSLQNDKDKIIKILNGTIPIKKGENKSSKKEKKNKTLNGNIQENKSSKKEKKNKASNTNTNNINTENKNEEKKTKKKGKNNKVSNINTENNNEEKKYQKKEKKKKKINIKTENINEDNKSEKKENDNKLNNINIPKPNNNKDFLKDLVKDSFTLEFLDYSFTAFKSIDNILYFISTNQKRSIISYNIIDNKKINEIKNAHKTQIESFRYYLDNTNKRDLIISLSSVDNNIKLWNIIHSECIFSIEKINNFGYLYSACFLTDKFQNKSYIMTSNFLNYDMKADPIRLFDLNGNKIKKIKECSDNTIFIDVYYDDKISKIYIITGNIGYIKSYDYYEDKLYYKYCDKNYDCKYDQQIRTISINFNTSYNYNNVIVFNDDENIKLIASSTDGNIRIWNFHSGELLNKIKIHNRNLYGICVWNKEYLFVGCGVKSVKLIYLKNGRIVKNIYGHKTSVLTMIKINHPKYGECLLSQDNSTKSWIVQNKY